MKVIILCGGMGTRLREETEYKPKPMVEIGGKPILWHIMKIYSHYGYKDFILALGYKGNIIRDYFLNYFYYNNDITIHLGNKEEITVHNHHNEEDWRVTLLDTGKDSMTGYRVKLAGQYIKEDRFMLTYGDAVADVNIEKLVEFHKQKNTIGTVTGVYPPSRFGDLVTDGDRVVKFKQQLKETENREPINGGFFVFKKEFLDIIPDDPSIDLEKLPLDKLVAMNELSVYRHKGFWQCMDTYRDFLNLNKLWTKNPIWKVWES
jgi:glucose-1-phosphate cytidylyltransferase